MQSRAATASKTWVWARGAQARAWRAVALTALVAAGLLGAPVLRDALTAARLEAITAQALGEPPPPIWDLAAPAENCGSACPPRANAAVGVHLTIMAARESDAAKRRRLLEQAEHRLSAALEVRSSAAGWWTWLAYARLLDGRDQPGMLDALARSYAAGPFLSQEGPWRARICAANWAHLDPALRIRVVNEAVWLRDIDPLIAPLVFDAFSDPSAAAALRAGLSRPPALLVPHRRSGGPSGVGALG